MHKEDVVHIYTIGVLSFHSLKALLEQHLKSLDPFFVFSFFACGCPVLPAAFAEKTILSSLNCLCQITEKLQGVSWWSSG